MAENEYEQISEEEVEADPNEIYHFIGKQFSDAAAPDIDDEKKLTFLKQAQERIFAAEDVGTVLDSFIDNFLSFFNEEENSIKIRIFTIKFIEKACRFDPSIVKKIAVQLLHSLSNLSDSSEIHKKIIIVVTQLYPVILQWVVNRKNDSEAGKAWTSFNLLKSRIMQMVDSKNEGIRVLTMRFLETLVICQTTKSEMSDLSKLSYQMSLNQVGRDHRFISYRQLETEAALSFKSLMDHLSSSRTTLLHLISTVTAVARISRARPEFMSQMVEAFESLLFNLPPTLGTGQVKSVRKELTNNLIRLLKHPAAFTKHLQRIQSLLNDLGASESEIKRNMPDPAEVSAALKKRVEANSASQKRSDSLRTAGGPLSKKARIEEDEYDDQKTASAFDDQEAQNRAYQEATDMTTNWILDKLQHGHIVSHLVYISLLSMPHEMPAAFSANTYGVPENVTPEVKRNVARMLATQFMREQKGPGAAYFSEIKKKQHLAKQKAKEEGVIVPPTPADLRDDKHAIKPPVKDDEGFAVPLLPSKTKKSAVKIDIFRETQPFSEKESHELRLLIFRRILESEAQMNHPKQRQSLYQSLVYIVTRFFGDITPELEEQLLSFIIADQKRRGEIIMLWLTELYSQTKGINCCIKDAEEGFTFTEAENNARYDTIMVNCLSRLLAQQEHKESLFHNIFLNAPVVTPGALLILRKACIDPESSSYSMQTLRELILNRNRHRYDFLKILLELSYIENDVVRHEAITVAKELAQIEYIYPEMREFIVQMCQKVTEATVPPIIWSTDVGSNIEGSDVQWLESHARAGLILALNMLTIDTSLVDDLTQTFAKSSRVVKSFLMKVIDKYATQLSQEDPNVMNAIDNCPSGGEALIARFVVNITAKTDPSPELVRRLKALQERYNSDIRSLIPIISGLTKEECLDLVPKFVLNATNLRTVPMFYKKILRSSNLVTKKPPVTVAELILKLHSIENVSAKAITLLQTSIDVLIVDQTNEFFEESDQIPNAINQLADLPTITPFVFHSIQRLYEKHPGLGDSLSKTLLKCALKRPWEQDPKAWEAFKVCSKAMGGYAYSTLLFGISWEKFTEFIEDQERDQLLGHKLKTYISTLPAHQQRKIDRRMIDFVKGELERDDNKKDKKKGLNDAMNDANWIQTHNLQSAFLAGGRREETEEEQNWLKEGVEEVIKAIDLEEKPPNESQLMEETEEKNEPKLILD